MKAVQFHQSPAPVSQRLNPCDDKGHKPDHVCHRLNPCDDKPSRAKGVTALAKKKRTKAAAKAPAKVTEAAPVASATSTKA